MIKRLLLTLLCLEIFCPQARSEMAANLSSKIFSLEGKHSIYGAFHGDLEFRPRADGDLDMLRQVTYDDYRYDGLQVQEIWTGVGKVKDGKLFGQFRLKQADIFKSADGQSRGLIQFQRRFSVPYRVSLDKPKAHTFSLSGQTDESWGASRPAGLEPLWKDERQAIASTGDCFQIIGNLVNSTLFLPVTVRYRTSPLLMPYLRRLDFKSGKQFFIYDPTDFQFLREHKNMIRVDDKIADKISLLESEMRHDAYAYTLEEKAKIFDKEMPENFLNGLGLFVGAVFDDKNKRIESFPDGDGALWSGMYAGSQAMRWLATKDPEAMANYKRVTTGLMLLMDLPSDPTEFARTAEITKPGEKLGENWRLGKVPHEQVRWVYGGNNDMVKGLFHAFAWGFEILPKDDPFRAELAAHAKRLSALKITGELVHPGNSFTANGLAALASGSSDDLNRYLLFYNGIMKPIDFFNLDKGYYHTGIADWSGVNLNMVSSVTDILIAKNLASSKLAESSGKKAEMEDVLAKLRLKLLNTWAIYSDARRDFLTIAADAFGAKNSPALNFPARTVPMNWAKKEIWPASLSQSIWGLREIPVLHQSHVFSYDYRLKEAWCPSPWPRLPWKAYTDENPDMQYHYQGAYNFPVFEASSCDDNFWTRTMDYRADSTPKFRFGRMDFLHAYWMGRLSGLFSEGS